MSVWSKGRAAVGAILALAPATAAGRANVEGRGPLPAMAACSPQSGPARGWTSGLAPPPGSSAPHVFRLSDCYPLAAPAEPQPWRRHNFRRDPERYLWAVLDYVYEGNIRPNVEASFDLRQNPVRGWYNAPWLDEGGNGREGVHGLTRERTSCPGELGASHRQLWENYAVGFYNSAGGVVLGKVWAGRGRPHPERALMPEGAVAAKLLFTTADPAEARFLRGSPTWTAYVYEDAHNPKAIADPQARRALRRLRLLQIDVAVRDRRADTGTGWVFGTFVYGGGGRDGRQVAGWRNVTPLGLMWGNDLTKAEQWLNPKIEKAHHLGWERRLDGPVDNPNSSCLSCHSTSQAPMLAPLAPANEREAPRWFRNIKAGEAFTPGARSLDYSLQLAFGIDNYAAALRPGPAPNIPDFCPVWRPTGPPRSS